jgi:uncharacterized protein (TIGR02453 family)
MSNLHITDELFAFLRELKGSNNREWFEANRRRYESRVREPLLQFIREFDFRLRDISPFFLADPRRVGGSLFRIHRDVRFSPDKRPYKTHSGIQFRHRGGQNVHSPGFYLHLEPDHCFIGLGLWRPDSRSLLAVRRAIVQDTARWRSIVGDESFRDHFRFGGECLTRAPRGFDPRHPCIDDLRRKDFVVFRGLSEAETRSARFIDGFADSCRIGAPFTRFLTEAVGLPW